MSARWPTAALVAGWLAVAVLPAWGEDQNVEPTEAGQSQPASPVEVPVQANAGSDTDVLAEWRRLGSRRRKLAAELAGLRAEFLQFRNRIHRRTIRAQFVDRVREWETTIEPQMVALALDVLAEQPGNELAAEMALDTHDYPRVIETAGQLIASGHKSRELVNLLAQAHFNLHHFAEAKQALTDAEQDDLLDEAGRQHLAVIDEYISAWPAEEQLRQQEDALPEERQLPRVKLVTSRGEIVLELFEDQAPNTVANFISLVESKTYNGTAFHRVMGNFMAQGGDPLTRDDDPDNDGLGGPGYTIKCECESDDARQHFRGSLSMAHAGRDTGSSQFFLTHRPTFHLNGLHTVFGRVLEGQEVVDRLRKGDRLERADVLRKRDHEYKPLTSKDKPAASTDAGTPATD